MKITSIMPAQSFKANGQDINFDASAKKEKSEKPKKKYVDPLANWPMRGLGYTNDIGIAINELAPNAARLFWVPALMYFGADIYDKYKNKGDKYKPNAQRAFNQAVFQACASIIFPAIFGHIGMSAFSQLDKYKGQKISTNAKEQTLRFIKGHSALNDVLAQGRDKDETIEEFTKTFDKYFTAKKKNYTRRNFIVKVYDKLLCNCKRGAIANSNEERIKNFAKTEFLGLLDTCKDTEIAQNKLDKKIFKLKVWKSAGAFAAIILTARAIDKFVETVIIDKVVRPQVAKINFSNIKKMNDFGLDRKAEEKTAA